MKVLGDFSLIKELGEGALGKTFLAEHRLLKRTFTLKVLAEEFSKDPGFITRFEKEIGAIASLDHPNIVKVHNVSSSDGSYYLVSDDVGQPQNLFAYLDKRALPFTEEELLKTVHQIAAAIDHGKVAHLGIKPSNVLIKETEEGLHVYLTDFGLSKVVTLPSFLKKLQQEFSQNLHFMQTFSFLAPEQKRGDLSIDARADVYAFGALIYFILTREFPDGIFELPKFAHYKLPWDQLIFRCMQKDLAKRPSTIKAALEELLPTGRKPVLKPQELERPEFDADPGAIFQTELTIGKYQPKIQEQVDIAPELTEMKIIDKGTYKRGSDSGARDELPRHAVNVDSFAIDLHPVTNEQFVLFLEALGGEKDVQNNDIIRLKDSRIKRTGGKLIIEAGYSKHPIVGVTWYGAIAYAKWVGKRLPTEAEWEIAAAGPSEMIYPTGSNIERSQANFFSSDTTAVMSYPANGYGLYDMAGNVYEWCQDWYEYHYYDASVQEPNNPKGPVQGVYRVLRGGCWKSLKEDLRCAHRHRNNPGSMNGTCGFRCATDVS